MLIKIINPVIDAKTIKAIYQLDRLFAVATLNSLDWGVPLLHWVSTVIRPMLEILSLKVPQNPPI